MTYDLTPGTPYGVAYREGSMYPDRMEGCGMTGCYRLLIVVDVLDGSAPSDIAARTRRRLGDVVRMEVLDDHEHEGADARRAQESPEQRAQGHWLDA